ncbi:MAG: type II secretion system protein [Candidatus Paceibacterota bacterium]
MTSTTQRGFTLIEILLVVAAIVILAGIVIVAINPAKQLADTRNAEREANVNAIADAIQQYAIDNNGILPSALPTSGDCSDADNEICQTDGTCTGLVDLSVLTDDQEYLTTMPTDPQETGDDAAGYHAVANANNRVTVCAPDAERDKTIEVTK